MPVYRVREATFLQPDNAASPSRFEQGSVVTYRGMPGIGLQPLDDAARRAKAASIPSHWRQRTSAGSKQVIRLARSLGEGPIEDAAHAKRLIEDFLQQFGPQLEEAS